MGLTTTIDLIRRRRGRPVEAETPEARARQGLAIPRGQPQFLSHLNGRALGTERFSGAAMAARGDTEATPRCDRLDPDG